MHETTHATCTDLQALDELVEALSTEARASGGAVAAKAAVALAAFRHRAAERDPAALGLAVTLMNRPEIWAALGRRPLDA